jgi:PEP-CTERM motif
MKTHTMEHMNFSQVEPAALRCGTGAARDVETVKRNSRTNIGRMMAMAILFLFSVTIAMADTITFSKLPGPDNSPFTAYNLENPWVVTPVAGNWFQSLSYGNPEPSIYDGPVGAPGNATVQVMSSQGLFTFKSVDYSSNNGGSTYEIVGLLGLTAEFDQKGNLNASNPPNFGFSTLASMFPNTKIDSLLISVTPGAGVTSINLDNIVVNPVGATPEPGSLLLLGSGVLGIGGLLRRRSLQRCMKPPANRREDQ